MTLFVRIQLIDRQGALALLASEITKAGSEAGWARKAGVDRPMVNGIRKGRRRFQPKVLSALGLRRIEAYVRARSKRSLRQAHLLDRHEALVLLRAEIAEAGSQVKWARKARVHRPNLVKMLRGDRGLQPQVIAALGLEKIEAYAVNKLAGRARRPVGE